MTAAFTTRPAPPEALSYFTDAHHDDGPFSAVEVRANGVLGLIYKATQGVTFRDPRFVAAMAQCAAAGLLRGAYHFASGTSDAVAQADAFMRVVGAIPGHDDVLLCLDLEGALDSPKTMTTPDAVRAATTSDSASWSTASPVTAISTTIIPSAATTEETTPPSTFTAPLLPEPIWSRPFAEPGEEVLAKSPLVDIDGEIAIGPGDQLEIVTLVGGG